MGGKQSQVECPKCPKLECPHCESDISDFLINEKNLNAEIKDLNSWGLNERMGATRHRYFYKKWKEVAFKISATFPHDSEQREMYNTVNSLESDWVPRFNRLQYETITKHFNIDSQSGSFEKALLDEYPEFPDIVAADRKNNDYIYTILRKRN
jgi:hypothetical protein